MITRIAYWMERAAIAMLPIIIIIITATITTTEEKCRTKELGHPAKSDIFPPNKNYVQK